MRHSVKFMVNAASIWLPGHKADQYFEGNQLIICKGPFPDTYTCFRNYLSSRNSLFRLHPKLWLRADGTIPTRSWFIKCLHHFFPSAIAGQSMHVGGATALAEAGNALHLIQTAGRWTSDTFNHYMRKNPFLFEALLIGHSSLHSHTSI